MQTLDQLRVKYVLGLSDKLVAMVSAFEQRDYASVARIAHQIHGSGTSFGFPRITAAGAEIEAACKSGQITLIRAGIAGFENCVTEVMESQSLKDSQ